MVHGAGLSMVSPPGTEPGTAVTGTSPRPAAHPAVRRLAVRRGPPPLAGHRRYEQEQEAGLHLPKRRKATPKRRKKAEPEEDEGLQDGLFAHPNGLF
jgi:hypothetical protein